MTNQEAAEMIRNDMKLHHDYLSGEYRKALKIAISALQTQDFKTRSCDTCKHNPVSKKYILGVFIALFVKLLWYG